MMKGADVFLLGKGKEDNTEVRWPQCILEYEIHSLGEGLTESLELAGVPCHSPMACF